MTVFDAYSRFYDLLYEEKDYDAECDFIELLWKRYASREIHTVLDLGCGTGGHALPLELRGYRVIGVDRSSEMLTIARQKSQSSNVKANWLCADIRNLHLAQTFDAIISMFAVMGYQTENSDVSDAFQTARLHLNPGGLFIFDVWFGPAVLTNRPTDRVKIIEQGDMRVIRFAQPEFDLLQHTVLVKYKLLHIQGDSVVSEVTEAHKMRFFFPQEVSYFLSQSGFRMLKLCPFLQPDDEMTTSHFNLTVIAEAI